MTGLICVRCGGDGTHGSAKHPYCKKCFKEKFDGDYEKYHKWFMTHHLW